MAKKKNKKRTGSRRPRRVSGIGGSTFTPILGAIAGGFASKMITKAVGAKVDPKLLAGGQIIIAALLLPKMMKGPLGAGVAAGIAANAGISLLQSMGVVSGVSDFYRLQTINGMRKIAGSSQQVLAGVDLVKDSADIRNYNSPNSSMATGYNQLAVLSGFMDSEYSEGNSDSLVD